MKNTDHRHDMKRRHSRLKRKADRLRKQIKCLDERRSHIIQKLRSLRYQLKQIEVADEEWDEHCPADTTEPRSPILRGQLPIFDGAFADRREA